MTPITNKPISTEAKMESISDILQWIEENSVALEEFEVLIGPELPTEEELQAALDDLFPELDDHGQEEENEMDRLIAENRDKICHICIQATATLPVEAAREILIGTSTESDSVCRGCKNYIRMQTEVPVGFSFIDGRLHAVFWIEGIMFSRERETFFEIMGE